MLRRLSLGLLAGAALLAPDGGDRGPGPRLRALQRHRVLLRGPRRAVVPGIAHQIDDRLRHLPGTEGRQDQTRRQELVCTQAAASQAPSKLWLPVGGEITVDIGLKVLIVKSANDVAVMLAEKVGGSQDGFVAEMNDAAKRLGMTWTTTTTSTGCPTPRQVTTARDLAVLARTILMSSPNMQAYSLAPGPGGSKLIRTHNGILVDYPGADRHEDRLHLQFRASTSLRVPRATDARWSPSSWARSPRVAPRPRLEPARERFQTLFLEVGVRHQSRRTCHASHAQRPARPFV